MEVYFTLFSGHSPRSIAGIDNKRLIRRWKYLILLQGLVRLCFRVLQKKWASIFIELLMGQLVVLWFLILFCRFSHCKSDWKGFMVLITYLNPKCCTSISPSSSYVNPNRRFCTIMKMLLNPSPFVTRLPTITCMCHPLLYLHTYSHINTHNITSSYQRDDWQANTNSSFLPPALPLPS